MVLTAQRNREFIAHLPSKCPWLGKAEVMSIRWFSPADDARLCGHERAMPLVTQAIRLQHDGAVCGWEVRSLPGNVGGAYCCLEGSIVPLVCDWALRGLFALGPPREQIILPWKGPR